MSESSDLRLADLLSSQSLAYYSWGTQTLWFSPFAAVTRRSPMLVLASIAAAGVGSWESEAEFRQTVSLLHELVHYAQDISTGVGHWDYVQRLKVHKSLLTRARNNIVLGERLIETDEARKNFTEAFGDSLYNAADLTRTARAETIKRELMKEPTYHSGDGTEELLSIESILEAEAVLQVYQTIRELRVTETAQDILENNRALFFPPAMAELYYGVFVQIMHSIVQGAGDIAGLTAERLDKLFVMYLWLLDVCLAYPPPTYFNKTGRDPVDFLPGLKFMHLNRALTAGIDNSEASIIGERGAEETVLQLSGVKYPLSSEIYEQWIQYFGSEPAFEDDPIAVRRSKLCEQRLNGNYIFRPKDVQLLIEPNMPLFFSDGRTPATNMVFRLSPDNIPGDASSQFDDFRAALLAHVRDMRLIQWFYLDRPFQCPIARECRVARPNCASGLAAFSDLPDDPGCFVGTGLHRVGFSLRGRRRS